MIIKVTMEVLVLDKDLPKEGDLGSEVVDLIEVEAVIIRTLARHSRQNGMQIVTVPRIKVEAEKSRRLPNDPARFAGGF
jgi:hypothetical protein